MRRLTGGLFLAGMAVLVLAVLFVIYAVCAAVITA